MPRCSLQTRICSPKLEVNRRGLAPNRSRTVVRFVRAEQRKVLEVHDLHLGRTRAEHSFEEVDLRLLSPRPRLYGLVGAEAIEQVWKERSNCDAGSLTAAAT